MDRPEFSLKIPRHKKPSETLMSISKSKRKTKKKLQIFPKDQKPIQNPFPISKRPLSGSM